MFLAVAEDGSIADGFPEKLAAPALLEAPERLQDLSDDLVRVLAEVSPSDVRILMPEQTYKDSYARIAPRAALETLVRLVCATNRVPVEMLHRNTARARLGMPRSGSLESHVPAVISSPVGKYWNAGRNLAAAAALAEAA